MKQILLTIALILGFNVMAQEARVMKIYKNGEVTYSNLISDIDSVKIEILPNVINGHEYVDLGLPSGLKWATCNVGATAPEKFGNYYAWGEITTKSEYTEENSVTYKKTMSDISGNAEYDVARADWGGTWRIPTYSEMTELRNNCTWTWTTQNGLYGYKVTGPNGNSIFLPAAGHTQGSTSNPYGYYWSSTPSSSTYRVDIDAYYISLAQGSIARSTKDRYIGQSVRPVSD